MSSVTILSLSLGMMLGTSLLDWKEVSINTRLRSVAIWLICFAVYLEVS